MIKCKVGKKALKKFECNRLRNGLGNAVATAVSKSLWLRSSLTKLNMIGCCLGQESLCTIADTLQGHSSLLNVSLYD